MQPISAFADDSDDAVTVGGHHHELVQFDVSEDVNQPGPGGFYRRSRLQAFEQQFAPLVQAVTKYPPGRE
jgi:hypothetical protein